VVPDLLWEGAAEVAAVKSLWVLGAVWLLIECYFHFSKGET
jgi:hypothetical protein